MVTIRALKTTAGEYGKLRRGQTALARPSIAKRLEQQGIVEILTDDDGTEPEVMTKENSLRIRQGGEMVFTSDEDRKIIKKDTVIKPEDLEPELPATVSQDFAAGEDKTVIAVVENGQITEVIDVKDNGEETESSEELVEEPVKENATSEEAKATQGHQPKATPKETPKKQFPKK